ncbi:glutathione S-transferase family protein [Beggiatoa leptomitoformis]|uniref:Glutathione S-transferase n=1 Tax=Beggiatoa leptomitoformis TaxID=288004 RepID=A0A2N9YGK1_9GAMM|nr:glutathione S-transferase family protein [Beggiatoa leptomitoformis]ALG68061.1 glutathione S-transferase [Beggiatoa leptomitoformis]AUI69648.1 glutathione S-transferase [Beggiatoa leptomitoformis]
MSSTCLIIGNKKYSSWSLRPWLFARYFNIPFEEIRLSLYVPSFYTQILQYSPSGRVPVLHDAGRIIWDSLAICEYLNETHLAGKGLPSDGDARAVARSVSAEMHAGFAELRKELPLNCAYDKGAVSISDSAQQEVHRICEIWRTCRMKYGQNGHFLFGDFSIADAMYAPVVLRFASYAVKLETIEQTYLETILALPALQAWISAGKAETEVLLSQER